MTSGYETFAPGVPFARNDNVEWDGRIWRQRASAIMPPARTLYRTVYDAVLRRTAML